MHLPSAVLATRDRYVAAFPLWSMPAGEAAEMRAREWTLGLIAQVGWEHDAQGYGSKRASADRPLSKDGMAQQIGATLVVYDMLSGAGTGNPSLNANPESQDITGQIFEFVQPYDVIGGQPTPPEPTPVPPQPGTCPPYDDAQAVTFGKGCNDVYNQTTSPIDPGMIAVQAMRCQWDVCCGGLSFEQSYKKHINELRAVYGLPPV